MCSIREAVAAMNEKAKKMKANGTNPYERQLQQLESDVRGHIKVTYILFL